MAWAAKQHSSLADNSRSLKLQSPKTFPSVARRRRKVTSVLQYPSSCSRPTTREAKETLLCSQWKGHTSAVSAALCFADEGGKKEVVTASLDKTMVLWRLEENEDGCELCAGGAREVVRLNPAGAPIFSLAVDGAAASGASPDERQQVFCGNAAKSIAVLEPPQNTMQEKVVLNGHSGWVRALAAEGRWLFSAGCNSLRQWDLARAVPRHVRDVTLVKGDILGIATAPGRVFTCGADGSIRAWEVGKKGELEPAGAREKAHGDRCAAVVERAGFLYSVSYDGSVKMWDALSLELVMEARGAHGGGRVNCAAVGPDGNLYTGGDDKLVRRWRLGTLAPAPNAALFGHHYSVRALAAGPNETLLSGDSSGELSLWRV